MGTAEAGCLSPYERLDTAGNVLALSGMKTKTPKLLRDMDRPSVLGYDLHRDTLTPVRHFVPNRIAGKDYGADPVGDGTFRMVPSGDIVDYAERNRRLA